MLGREDDVSLEVLRQFAQRRVDQTSLSQAAREIGITHPTLREFLNGAAPRTLTAAKLRAWYEPDANELVRLRVEVETLKKRLARLDAEREAAAAADTEDGFPTDEMLRAALRRAVATSSLRTVAQQVGLTHRGLQLYLTGESHPRAATARKLRDWYVREGVHGGGVTPETARAAVDALLADLPDAERGRATSELLEAVRQMYRRAKMEPPAWTKGE